MNPLFELRRQSQSIWLDYIRRDLIQNGELKQLIENDGLRGVTSNPSIFEKTIDDSTQYDEALQVLFARNLNIEPGNLYDELSIEDVRSAADTLRPAYKESGGADGFVSIEPPPQLTGDTQETIKEGRRLWRTVNRPNLMIKVVAATEGIQAVEALIASGINVNITLMFSLSHYVAVARAYIRALQRCSKPDKIASVVSFFVSRVDSQVDRALETDGSPEALALRGKPSRIRKEFTGASVKSSMGMTSQLRQKGAHVQRPLCASEGSKLFMSKQSINDTVTPFKTVYDVEAKLKGALSHGTTAVSFPVERTNAKTQRSCAGNLHRLPRV